MKYLKRFVHLLLVVSLCIFCRAALAADEGKACEAPNSAAQEGLAITVDRTPDVDG